MRFKSYDGHFPGDPVVPGAALLTAVEGVAGRPVARLDRVRFLEVVRPGEDIDIDVALDGDRARFRLLRAGVEVARGIATLAADVAVRLDPVRLAPTLARPLWGGTTLAREFGKDPDPNARIGESWEVWRENRARDGRRLADIAPLPLLVKLLDVRETLSVQVHPDDAAARAAGHAHGKHEGWVVLRADPGARVAYGFNRSLGEEELRARALSGAIEADLAWREVRAGDVIDVPPGTVHAIGGGVLFYEVQQPCDLTWRLYDWGRGRPLHLDQALGVVRREPCVSEARARPIDDGAEVLLDSAHFRVERLVLPRWRETRTWEAVTVIEGEACVGDERVAVGNTVILPPGGRHIGGEGVVLAACAG
jgi:mannose-6-phosphate isomerase